MAQETSNNVLWAFFLFALPIHCFPLISSHLVVLLSPTVLSLCLAWWQCCHYLTVLKWHPFPPHEQVLTLVVLSAVVAVVMVSFHFSLFTISLFVMVASKVDA